MLTLPPPPSFFRLTVLSLFKTVLSSIYPGTIFRWYDMQFVIIGGQAQIRKKAQIQSTL